MNDRNTPSFKESAILFNDGAQLDYLEDEFDGIVTKTWSFM